MNLNQVTLPSNNIERSKLFYSNLGLRLIVDTDHYLRFECPDGDSTFSIHLTTDSISTKGMVTYFECLNLDFQVSQLKKKGISFIQEPKDQPWLWREAKLEDPDGNNIILYNAGDNRKNPPWRIN